MNCQSLPVPAVLFGIVCGAGALGSLPLAAAPLLVETAGALPQFAGGWAGVPATLLMAGSALGSAAAARLIGWRPPHWLAIIAALAAVCWFGVARAVMPLFGPTALALLLAGLGLGVASGTAASLMAAAPSPTVTAAAAGLSGGIMLMLFGAVAAAAVPHGFAALLTLLMIAAALVTPGLAGLGRVAEPYRMMTTAQPGALAPRRGLPAFLLGLLLYAGKDSGVWALTIVRAQALGVDAGLQSLLLGGAGAAGIGGAALAAATAGRWPAGPTLLAMLLANLLLGLCLFGVPSPSWFIVLQWLYTASHLYLVPCLLGLAGRSDGTGRLVALAVAASTMGAAMGPWLASVAWSVMTPVAVGLGTAILTSVAALFILPMLAGNWHSRG